MSLSRKARAQRKQDALAAEALAMQRRAEGVLVSPEEIARKATASMGWTRAQLAEWGVSWPPRNGWKAELERRWRNAQKVNA